MLDLNAFFTLNYGLYLISAAYDGKASGCTVNTLAQVTAVPCRMTVAINKESYTAELIEKSGFYTGVVLAKDADMKLIGTFGFRSGRELDKFAPYRTERDENGAPYVAEQVVARFTCRVTDKMDADTHIIFLGEVAYAEQLSDTEPMSYGYYHTVKKGRTPPKASSYQPPAS